MDVLIRLQRERPPVGELVVVDEMDATITTTRFVGWLGLIRALEVLVDEGSATPEA